MTSTDTPAPLELELRAIRAEIGQLREEQKEMAAAIGQLLTTFRGLATHLGIATEPYGRRSSGRSERDPPGFG